MHDLIISLSLMYLKVNKILKIASSICDESNYMKILTHGYKRIASLQNFVLKLNVLMLTVASLMGIVRKLKVFGKS